MTGDVRPEDAQTGVFQTPEGRRRRWSDSNKRLDARQIGVAQQPVSASSIFVAVIAGYFGDMAHGNINDTFSLEDGSLSKNEDRFAAFYGQTVSGEIGVLWTSAVTGMPPNSNGLGWYIPNQSH